MAATARRQRPGAAFPVQERLRSRPGAQTGSTAKQRPEWNDRAHAALPLMSTREIPRKTGVGELPPATGLVCSRRLREKLRDSGPAALTDAELLAVLLRTGTGGGGGTAIDLGQMLLEQSGGLRALSRSTRGLLTRQFGMGPAKVATLLVAFELARRLGEERFKRGSTVRSSADVFRHCCQRMASLRKEVFRVILLDGKNRVLKDIRVSEGSLTTSLVHPREVFVPVIEESAASLILVHNHPSGDPAPSSEDLAITKRLKEVGELLGVRLLDHLIVGDGRYVSFADEGLL